MRVAALDVVDVAGRVIAGSLRVITIYNAFFLLLAHLHNIDPIASVVPVNAVVAAIVADGTASVAVTVAAFTTTSTTVSSRTFVPIVVVNAVMMGINATVLFVL